MRVVAGKYRGKKLKEFDINSTRPTMDRVKESIFNLIQFDVADAIILDLFSGTGALGIEAISRGAKLVYFVDSNKEAIKLINSNLKGIEGNFKVCHQDYLSFLKLNKNLKFDIVLLDPPFKENLGETAIKFIIENNMLNENGIIIFETSTNRVFKLENPSFSCVRKKYGSVAVFKIVKL